MKLLFDLFTAQSALLGAGGGGEYARSVFRRLAGLANSRNLGIFHHPGYPLDPDIERIVEEGGFERHETTDEKELQSVVSTGRYTRFMSGVPYQYHSIDFSGLDVFFAVHGLRPIEMPVSNREIFFARSPGKAVKWAAKMLLPKYYRNKRRLQFQKLVTVKARSRRLIVASRHTMGSILDNLTGFSPGEIVVLDCPPTAVCSVSNPDLGVLDRLGVAKGRYLLIVSGNRWVKNTHLALEAAIATMEACPDGVWMPIVVTGGVPWGLPKTRRRYVIDAGTVGLEELAALYKGAYVLFYPTLNEGYGYPPLEAMSQGTPVLSSAVSSLTELLGDAVIYFNPTDAMEIRNRVRLVLEDPAVVEEYKARGTRHFELVSSRQEAALEQLCDMLLEE